MSQQTTFRKLAALVNTPVDKLLEQLAEAAMKFDDPDQVVTSTEKVKPLGFLRRTHGTARKASGAAVAPKKITLTRSRKHERPNSDKQPSEPKTLLLTSYAAFCFQIK